MKPFPLWCVKYNPKATTKITGRIHTKGNEERELQCFIIKNSTKRKRDRNARNEEQKISGTCIKQIWPTRCGLQMIHHRPKNTTRWKVKGQRKQR